MSRLIFSRRLVVISKLGGKSDSSSAESEKGTDQFLFGLSLNQFMRVVVSSSSSSRLRLVVFLSRLIVVLSSRRLIVETSHRRATPGCHRVHDRQVCAVCVSSTE